MVLEDMLKVVTGDLEKYPFAPKKSVKVTPSSEAGAAAHRSQSLTALKNKRVLVKSRLAPGERLSNLQKMRNEEKQK